MAYRINAEKVRELVARINEVFRQNPDYNHGETIIALSEYIARVVVSTAKSKVQADEMIGIARQHMELTVKIGAEAQDKRIITEL